MKMIPVFKPLIAQLIVGRKYDGKLYPGADLRTYSLGISVDSQSTSVGFRHIWSIR